jgi:hypothetical protein
VTLVRVQQSATATITRTFTVDRVLTDAAGSVTVTVKRLDGVTVVVTGSATRASLGTYTYALPASAVLDAWDVVWSGSIGGATVVSHDRVEQVGGFLFGLDEATTELQLQGKPLITTAMMADKRTEVEQECELRICRRAFVPRFHREVLNPTMSERLPLTHSEPRVVRSVTVDGVVWTAAQLATITLVSSGVLRLPAGVLWMSQPGGIVVEYEHGLDFPPEGIRTAAITRLQSKLNLRSSGIPSRAQSFTPGDGGTYRLVLPDKDSTGLPDVDAEYKRYARPRRAVVA